MKKIIYSLSILALGLLGSCSEDKGLDLNVMTYNIRYDEPQDSLNNWQYRKHLTKTIVEQNDIDIFGTQEVLHNQFEDIKGMLPQYSAVGVGREDGITKGEYSAIFYKTERFKTIETGYFWLSETPEIAGSKGWDGACERIATWAVLEDKVTEKKLFFINTHLDHIGQTARIEGVRLLKSRADELGKGYPLIMTGDFNAEPTSDVIHEIIDTDKPNYLVNTKDVAQKVLGPNYTFHDYGRASDEKKEYIDYIFVSEGTQVSKYEVLPEQIDGVYISDHCPVVAKITLKY